MVQQLQQMAVVEVSMQAVEVASLVLLQLPEMVVVEVLVLEEEVE